MIKKELLKKLLRTYDLPNLEKHLIYTYLIINKIKYIESSILRAYLTDFVINPDLNASIISLNLTNIKELENYLELIIPFEDRKLNGAFFTPDYIIDFIISEIKPKEADTNLDPSCGCGAFLVGLTDYLKRMYKKPIRVILRENIFGSDILKYNIHRTKLILTIYALQHGEHVEDSDFNLYHQDSLRANWESHFDNIVGNPPYVKFQDLTDINRVYLAEHWTTVKGGTFNLYYAFFELGYKLIHPL